MQLSNGIIFKTGSVIPEVTSHIDSKILTSKLSFYIILFTYIEVYL